MKSTVTVCMKGDVAEVRLYGLIGFNPWEGKGVSADEFRDAVKGIKARTMNLRVHSPGGDVFDAAAMITALNEFKGRIEVDVDGLAASAASYLIMPADVIRVGSNSQIMIHDPYAGVLGTANDMRGMASLLETVKGQILDTYERKSKVGRDQLSAWMSEEKWFTGQKAVDAGLADSVTEPVRVAALAQFSGIMAKLKYKNVPPIPQDGPEWEATRMRQEIAAALNAKA